MDKLNTLQKKLEKFIEDNKIHLRSFAVFNRDKFKSRKALDEEIKHARIILANSLVKKLMSEEKIKKYLKEFPPEKGETDTTLEFEVFVFSGTQIRTFIDLIQSHSVVDLTSRILH